MLNEEFKKELSSLSLNEKKETIKLLSNLLVTNNDTKSLKCPNCGSLKFVKCGHQNGVQRYKCSCGKTFCSKALSLNYYSKVDLDTWLKVIDYEISGLTLTEISYYLRLSVTTCFRMRHKLYNACSIYLENIKLQGQTEIDCSYIKINLKGTKPNKMPRKSKKNGRGSTYSGISHHKVCIIVGLDEHDNHFMKVAGLGSESFEKYSKFTSNFEKSSILISDSKACIHQFANHLNISDDIIKSIPNDKNYTTENGNNIQSLNEFSKCIADIIRKYHGVSIRHLDGYLAFQSLKKMIHYRNTRDNEANAFITNLTNEAKPKLTKEICKSQLPVDLKEAYWEFNYGIFRH